MYEFLNTYNLPRMNHEEIGNLSRPITSKEIQSVIKNFSTMKRPGSDGFTGEYYQTFKEELMPKLLQLHQETQEDGTLPN